MYCTNLYFAMADLNLSSRFLFSEFYLLTLSVTEKVKEFIYVRPSLTVKNCNALLKIINNWFLWLKFIIFLGLNTVHRSTLAYIS